MNVRAAADSPPLILASSSPQRQRLLTDAGYTFRVVAPSEHAECGICSRETPGELVARLGWQKAADVAGRLAGEATTGEVIVACDTVAECLGNILGKPADRAHAEQMLRLLSGRDQRVYSGLCVWPLNGAPPKVDVARTTLVMQPLSEAQITEYLDSGLWQAKAGAFGYQDRHAWLEITEGSESNVVGLPLELLGQMLDNL